MDEGGLVWSSSDVYPSLDQALAAMDKAIADWTGVPTSDQLAADPVSPTFTPRQGQYLAFIYNYTQMYGRPPAEGDIERFLQVSPPSVHQMILKLEEKGFISRIPRQPRSIKILVEPDEIPRLLPQ